MKENILIYMSDYEVTEDEKCKIYFEYVDKNTVENVKNGNFIAVENIEISMSLTSLFELDYWNDSFVFFEQFNLSLNGFLNAKKGGNVTDARKLNGFLRVVKKELLNHVKPWDKEGDVHSNKRCGVWFYCVLNVGRGESNLIITPSGEIYLFDGGDSIQNVSAKISNVIKYINRRLNAHIVDEISGLFISHPDNDHFRGVIDVISSHKLKKNCFLYYNHHGHYPKPNWVSALGIILAHLNSNNISQIVSIPNKNDLNSLSTLLSGLFIKTTWPYDIGKSISKANGYNANDSSHCIYVGRGEKSLSVNLFGDIEKDGWEKNGDLPYQELTRTFIFKPSHHGRLSGDPKVSFSNSSRVNSNVDNMLKNNSIISKYVSSAMTNTGPQYSPLASKATLSSSATNGVIYAIFPSGRVLMEKA